MSLIRFVGYNCLVRYGCLKYFKRCESFYDPPYLASMKPKIPLFGPLNVKIRGYDFALIESYQKLVNKIAKTMDIEVADGWAVPAKVEKIQKFKPNSAIVENEYTLSTYERYIQVLDLPRNIAPIFVEIIQAALPQGVSMEVCEHLEEHENIRYVPDYELKELKSQLDSMADGGKKK